MFRLILCFFLLVNLVGAQMSLAVSLPIGVYVIARPQVQLITASERQPESIATLLPPTGNLGDQEFEIINNPDRTVHIRNIESRLYLSSKNEPNALITLETQPKRWSLIPGTKPSYYIIQLPGSPVDGQILVIDLSLLKIFPPRLALRPLRQNDVSAQQFQFALQL
ncbi:hypothetical protein K7432_016172 [Basidiobolus ranarum]|uniref:Uncharacterized protein n=1 Tax=Basidiobolus ranarum TaxID=34480 RepID=A0ABR2VN69_9FUNG